MSERTFFSEQNRISKFVRPLIVAAAATVALVGCEEPKYEQVTTCDIVDDRLTTTGSEFDAGKFFWDGEYGTKAKDIYMIHTPTFGSVEVGRKQYMDYPIGSQYCQTKRVRVSE